MLPPSEMTVVFRVHITGPESGLHLGTEIFTGIEGELIAMESTGWELGPAGQRALTARLRHHLTSALEAVGPF